MTCEQLVDLLVEYVEGELDAPTAEEVERHARECPDCDHFVTTYRATIALAERALSVRMPPTARLAMEQKLRKAIAGEG